MPPQHNPDLQGNFQTHPFAELLIEIAQASLGGSIRISHKENKTIVYFDGGRVVFAVSNAEKLKLPEILRSQGRYKNIEDLPQFGNELELLEYLREDKMFVKKDLDYTLYTQVEAIILDVLSWPEGDWSYNSLARARGDVCVNLPLPSILLNYARVLPEEFVAERFRSYLEVFKLVSEEPNGVELHPDEAFLCSRIQEGAHSVNDIISASGMTEGAVTKSLYGLWLAGLLNRYNWNPAFSEIKIAAIRSANLVLKKGAPKVSKTTPKPVPVEKPAPPPELPVEIISVGEYLARVETADSFYHILGLAPESSLDAIRKSYFNLAKLFHPDHYHRGEGDQLRRIENAFANLAQAYETLKNAESRRLYDSKLKREQADNELRRSKGAAESEGNYLHGERAAQEFEHGRSLMAEGDWETALPFLTRAVHFAPKNARYHAFHGKALSNDESQRHKAVNAMQAAVNLEPQNPAFRMMLAEFFVRVNLNKRAEGELTRLLAIQPDHKDAQSLLDSLSRK